MAFFERRTMKSEVRAEKGPNGELYIGGYAATFNTESKDLGGFREVVAPGAFTRSIKEKRDVKALFNHDANFILGRIKNATLTVAQDEKGLAWRCELNQKNSDHVNMYANIERGDIDECSFAFTVTKDGQVWAERQSDGGAQVITRTLTDVDLYDVSAVCYPAYPGTDVGTRGDVVAPEVRSMIEDFAAKRGLGTAPTTPVVTPEAPVVPEVREQSLEDKQRALCNAVNEKYPSEAKGDCWPGKYWIIETYAEYVIVCEAGTGDYFKITYAVSGDTYAFGDPSAVEQAWVPSERTKAQVAELRTKEDAARAAVTPAAAPADAPAPAAETRDAEDDDETECPGCEDEACEFCSAKRKAKEEVQRSADEVGDKQRRVRAAMLR